MSWHLQVLNRLVQFLLKKSNSLRKSLSVGMGPLHLVDMDETFPSIM